MSLRFHAQIASFKNSKFWVFKKLYKKAFPLKQRIPTFILLLWGKKKHCDFLFLFDENEFIGFTFLISHKNLTYVLYLAIVENLRSSGYGSKALKLIKSLYPNQKIFLNIDVINAKAVDNEKRIARKNFYLKNGFCESNIMIYSSYDISETLFFGASLSTDEVKVVFNKFIKNFFQKLLRIRIVEK